MLFSKIAGLFAKQHHLPVSSTGLNNRHHLPVSSHRINIYR